MLRSIGGSDLAASASLQWVFNEVPFGYWIVLGPSHGDPYEAGWAFSAVEGELSSFAWDNAFGQLTNDQQFKS